MSKDSQASMLYVGRWWGIHGAQFLPWAEKFIMAIADKRACDVIRYMRRYARLRVTRAYKTLSVYCDVDAWVKHLPMLLYPDEIPPHTPGELRSPIFAMERA